MLESEETQNLGDNPLFDLYGEGKPVSSKPLGFQWLSNLVKMKILIWLSALILVRADDPGSIKKAPISISVRAPSGQVNCDCQCESPAYQWTAKGGIIAGDCKA